MQVFLWSIAVIWSCSLLLVLLLVRAERRALEKLPAKGDRVVLLDQPEPSEPDDHALEAKTVNSGVS
jgi:hypothetical protein